MKASELQHVLDQIMRDQGDLDVVLATDEEGNSFYDLYDYGVEDENWEDPVVILWPGGLEL